MGNYTRSWTNEKYQSLFKRRLGGFAKWHSLYSIEDIELKITLAMIPLNDFQVLPFDKKCDYITIFADYMIYRVEDEKKYYLYHVDTYFIEVCYAPYENRVLGIKAFTNTANLEPYLESVNIGELSF